MPYYEYRYFDFEWTPPKGEVHSKDGEETITCLNSPGLAIRPKMADTLLEKCVFAQGTLVSEGFVRLITEFMNEFQAAHPSPNHRAIYAVTLKRRWKESAKKTFGVVLSERIADKAPSDDTTMFTPRSSISDFQMVTPDMSTLP